MTHAPDLTQPSEDSPAHSLLAAGVAASQSGDSQRAIELFEQAGAVAPAWGMPHFLAGSEHAALHDWTSAEMKFARAVALDPGMEIARYQYGLLQFTSGKPDAAMVVWQPLLASTESPWLGDFVRGFAAVATDDFTHARACFDSGLGRVGVNPAVASDIYKMLDGMAQAQRVVALRGELAKSTAVSASAASDQASHVLVANYDKLKLH